MMAASKKSTVDRWMCIAGMKGVYTLAAQMEGLVEERRRMMARCILSSLLFSC